LLRGHQLARRLFRDVWVLFIGKRHVKFRRGFVEARCN
jgi:hypothetical protein